AVTLSSSALPSAQQPPPGTPANPPPTPRPGPAPMQPAGGAAATPGAAPGQAPEAPIMRFAAAGIGIDEAVRNALEFDAGLQRQLAAAEFSSGVALEQTGSFDYVLQGGIQYQRRVQELSESRKQSERDKRDRLDQVIADNKTAVANAQRLLPILEQLQTAPPGQEPIAAIRAIDPSIADLLQVFDNLIAANTTNAQLRQSLLDARQSFINNSLGANFRQSLQDQIQSYND